MTEDLRAALNALAIAVENTLRHPELGADFGPRLIDLHADLVEKICEPREHHRVMDGNWMMAGERMPTTTFEAMEAIARYRAAYMAELEAQPVMVH